MRREGFRRPELLPPNAHSIDQSVIGDSMGMHDMGHGLEDVQVGFFLFLFLLFIYFIFWGVDPKILRGCTSFNMHNFYFLLFASQIKRLLLNQ